MKDLNELQAMNKGLLKHTAVLAQILLTTETKDRIDVLDLDKSSMYGQDALHQLAFVAIEMSSTRKNK